MSFQKQLQELEKRVLCREKELSEIIFIARELAETYGTVNSPYEGEDVGFGKKHEHRHFELRNFGNFHFMVDAYCSLGDNRVRIFTAQPKAEVFSVSLASGLKVEVFDDSPAWKKILNLTWRTRKQIAKSTDRQVKMVKMRLVQKRLSIDEFNQQYNSLLEKAKELGMTI